MSRSEDFDKSELTKLDGQLSDLETKIREMSDTHRTEAKKFGDSKSKFEIANAGALLAIFELEASSGEKLTESIRKAKALKQCEKEYTDYRVSEAEMDSSREVLRSLQAELSSVQTRCSLFKAEMNL